MSVPTYLSIRAAAEKSGFSEKTVRRRIADGSIPATRIGPRSIRIREDDLAAWLRGSAA
nr:helix-turn-helix domain-containing protein [Gordonia malaquae]